MKNLVSFIIINYNGGHVVLDCIRSIKNQDYKKTEIIVVDNNSKDGSLQNIKKSFPRAKIIALKENKGYAGGINAGYKKSKGDYIVVMNNDLILGRDMTRILLNNSDKGDILGVKNYYYDKPKILWATGVRINPLLFKARLIGLGEVDKGQYDLTKFDHVVGSFLFIKRKVFEKIGGFNGKYFCYYEETEFQQRAKKNGFRVTFVPKAKLLHHVAYSSGGGSNKITDYYLVRNRGKFIREYQKAYLKPASYASLLVESILRSIRQLSKRNFGGALFPLRGFKDFLMGNGGAIK